MVDQRQKINRGRRIDLFVHSFLYSEVYLLCLQEE